MAGNIQQLKNNDDNPLEVPSLLELSAGIVAAKNLLTRFGGINPGILTKATMNKKSKSAALKVKEEAAEKCREAGNMEFKRGDFAAAIKQYDKSIELNATVAAYANRAQAHLDLGSYDDAIRDAQSALNMEPNHLKARFRLGRALFFKKMFEKAMKHYEKCLEKEPKNKWVHQAVGQCKESMWSNNKWHISDRELVQVSTNGLIATYTKDVGTNVRAQQPISRANFVFFTGLKLVYWEVLVKKASLDCIGWVDSSFPLNDHMIGPGHHPGTYGIDLFGNYWESEHKHAGYGTGIVVDDVVGTGLLLTRDRRLKLFFTKNGQLNGKPIDLKDGQDLELFPAVSLFYPGASVEANFGAGPTGKPFKFNINAHAAQLFQ